MVQGRQKNCQGAAALLLPAPMKAEYYISICDTFSNISATKRLRIRKKTIDQTVLFVKKSLEN